MSDVDEPTPNVKPELAHGDLVKVARAQNQPEAELLQGMLCAEGVPSVLRRAPGFDVPDFLAAGPRDVLVPASGAQFARDVLRQPDLEAVPPVSDPIHMRRLLVAVLIAAAVVALVICVAADVF